MSPGASGVPGLKPARRLSAAERVVAVLTGVVTSAAAAVGAVESRTVTVNWSLAWLPPVSVAVNCTMKAWVVRTGMSG